MADELSSICYEHSQIAMSCTECAARRKKKQEEEQANEDQNGQGNGK